MANKDGHRRFGNVRKLPSGRYQIRYPGPDGQTRTGPETYERKTDADKALVIVEGRAADKVIFAVQGLSGDAPVEAFRSGLRSAGACGAAGGSCFSLPDVISRGSGAARAAVTGGCQPASGFAAVWSRRGQGNGDQARTRGI